MKISTRKSNLKKSIWCYIIKKLILALLIFTLLMNVVSCNKDTHSETQISESNIVIMVSNQSRNTPTITLEGFVDEKEIFSGRYKVKNSHKVYYYYENLDLGEHMISINSKDGAKKEEFINIKADKTLWIFITYWSYENGYSKIDLHSQYKAIAID